MFDSVIASVIFEFLGALTKWIFFAVLSFIKGENARSFTEFWEGSKSKNEADIVLSGISNVVLGGIVCFLILVIIAAIFFSPPFRK